MSPSLSVNPSLSVHGLDSSPPARERPASSEALVMTYTRFP